MQRVSAQQFLGLSRDARLGSGLKVLGGMLEVICLVET